MSTSQEESPLRISDELIVVEGSKELQASKFKCPSCLLILMDAVQTICGHWLCQKCVEKTIENTKTEQLGKLVCLTEGCGERLSGDDGTISFFPDRFVRRQIWSLKIKCVHYSKGCQWIGKYSDLKEHLSVSCDFNKLFCEHCSEVINESEKKQHKFVCPKVERACPIAAIGCPVTDVMVMSDLQLHMQDYNLQHMDLIVAAFQLSKSLNGSAAPSIGYDPGYVSMKEKSFAVEPDGPAVSHDRKKDSKKVKNAVQCNESLNEDQRKKIIEQSIEGLRIEMERMVKNGLQSKNDELSALKAQCTKVEKSVRSKHAEFEDRDFRLSLIENSNYDGTMIWKIPQFSQRMSDAESGKYTSIFSLPFYTGRYGYKMCLRLYILGDGIGKNTHMSLFFVIMHGEFDNVLQWPFTAKVTFKLLNQGSGRDVIDTFQPDPMSSSFRKPKSDMNIASGCPRFVSHSDLKSGGFIVDDTIFIKCMVETTTIHHP